MKGQVTFWNAGRGYGFISSDHGRFELFVHASEVRTKNGRLSTGQFVEFDIDRPLEDPPPPHPCSDDPAAKNIREPGD